MARCTREHRHLVSALLAVPELLQRALLADQGPPLAGRALGRLVAHAHSLSAAGAPAACISSVTAGLVERTVTDADPLAVLAALGAAVRLQYHHHHLDQREAAAAAMSSAAAGELLAALRGRADVLDLADAALLALLSAGGNSPMQGNGCAAIRWLLGDVPSPAAWDDDCRAGAAFRIAGRMVVAIDGGGGGGGGGAGGGGASEAAGVGSGAGRTAGGADAAAIVAAAVAFNLPCHSTVAALGSVVEVTCSRPPQHLPLVQGLMAHGPFIEAVVARPDGALHLCNAFFAACNRGDEGVARALIQQGALVRAVAASPAAASAAVVPVLALQVASGHGHRGILRCMLADERYMAAVVAASGPEAGGGLEMVLGAAAARGDTATLRMLLACAPYMRAVLSKPGAASKLAVALRVARLNGHDGGGGSSSSSTATAMQALLGCEEVRAAVAREAPEMLAGAAASAGTYLDGLPLTPVARLEPALLQWADVVVLAVQAAALPALVLGGDGECGRALAGKVVVDITNPSLADIEAMLHAAGVSCGGGGGGSSPSPSSSSSGGAAATAAITITADSAYGGASWPAAAQPSGGSGSSAAAAADAKPITAGRRRAAATKAANANASGAHALTALLAAAAAASPSAGAAASPAAKPVTPPPRVVKALNNVSSYALINSDPLVDTVKTVAASDDVAAAEYAATLEGWHRTVFADWQMPTVVMTVTFILLEIFTAIRYNLYGKEPWDHMILWITNKAAGWAALWGMLYCYLPGLAVTLLQLATRRPSFRLWGWVQRWMDVRKQLGLLSLLLMLLHLAFSTYLFFPAYYSKLWGPVTTNLPGVVSAAAGAAAKFDKWGYATKTAAAVLPAAGNLGNATAAAAAAASPAVGVTGVQAITLKSRLTWQGESSMLIGILAGVTMCLTGLTSLPHITHRLNWSEWVLAQSWLGWFSFCCATAHTLILGITWWPQAKTAWPAGIPTITLLSTAPCVVVIAVKLLLALPPLSWALRKVRNGGWGRPSLLHAIYVKRA
ncbi:hypothetical protein HYH02_008394 [Chlamydomonas schloesseri]|uniref:Ferric oxidoreductase domain-containing protein n=1 Tax=Chlamydomonas schloesseri TaxID=2026947 RepID=A0A835WFX2_9CHLO|nr:hypothetical protein HYH02_008394 [Chlamydomonas schloesseri]|eukprot:KAG2446834.1 hypothetical protein HYH02_008394 [Chlamydomonas schloesseri]